LKQPDWYSPSSVTSFKRQQVIWLISILNILQLGEFPPNPKESGYDESGIGHRQVSAKAKFTIAAEIYTELTLRIEKCGEDGLWLEQSYGDGAEYKIMREEHIAKTMHVDINEVDRRVNQALVYVSGKRMKQKTYKDWKNHR
jgi:hypothetical protein